MNDQKKAALCLSEFASGNALKVSTPKASPKAPKGIHGPTEKKKKEDQGASRSTVDIAKRRLLDRHVTKGDVQAKPQNR